MLSPSFYAQSEREAVFPVTQTSWGDTDIVGWVRISKPTHGYAWENVWGLDTKKGRGIHADTSTLLYIVAVV